MKKRLISILLVLCLMLSVFCVPAGAEGGTVQVYSEEDFYTAFPPEDGVVTVPAGYNVIVWDRDFRIEEKIVIAKNDMFIISNDCTAEVGSLVNDGSFATRAGAALTVVGECVNNNYFAVGQNSLFIPMSGFDNNAIFNLDGYYLCGVIGAHDGQPQTLTYRDSADPTAAAHGTAAFVVYGSVVLANMDDEHPADLGAAADDMRAIYPADGENPAKGFNNAVIYAWAHDFGELDTYNSDDRLDGVYVEGRFDRELIPVGEDITISKKLCVGPCDLVLQAGKTLTIDDPDNLLFRENGRIVCEAAGAASPDAPAGGTLILGGKPILSGDPEKAPVNPTQDIVWLTSIGDENGRYPAYGDFIFIGDMSGAELHGTNIILDNLAVVAQGRDSRIKLTGNFWCYNILLGGEVDLNGLVLNAHNIYYGNDSRILYNGELSQVRGTPNYEIVVDAGMFGHFEDIGRPEGTKLYLESDMHIPCGELMNDPSFLGWRFDSGWDVPQNELDALEVKEDPEKENDKYYITVPAFPIMLRAEWDTVRVELTKYDTTVAFDGIKGHTYSMAYLDSLNSTDAELAEAGVDRNFVDHITDRASEMAGGEILDLISVWLYDGERELTDNPFEMRIKLPEGWQDYDSVQLKIVHIDGEDDVHVDPEMIPCHVEDGVLFAELNRNESAFIVVGSGLQEIKLAQLSLERPMSGSETDTPQTPDGSDWERHRQSNKPRVSYQSGRGAYVESTLWTLPGEGDIPFVGAFENGKPYTFEVMVLAEPGYCFADDVQIVIDGAKYVSHTTHIMDENGKCDILYITATAKPVPTNVKLGDTDDDKSVTIIDATYIQRELADLPNTLFVDEAANVDGDESISILDATAIQRWLAGFDDHYPIDEPVHLGA